MATKTRPRPVQAKPEPNAVVARRLAFLDDAKRRAAAKRFAEGESIAKLAEELDLGMTHAAYCLRQELVEAGQVSRLPEEADAIKAALADGDDEHNDWHWLACRTGLSTGKVKNLVG